MTVDVKQPARIVDTHQHLWDVRRFSYAWLRGFPTLNRNFLLDDYHEAIHNVPITKTVYVEGDVDEPYILDETRWALEIAERDDTPVEGVVAGCRPERTDFPDYLKQIAGHPKLKGLRRVLHTQPDELARSLTFIENLRLLERYGLTFDLCVLSRQLPIAIELVRQCPGVRFILDHCGIPQVKERIFDPWRAYIEEISEFPNVVCKISGIVAYADPVRWTVDDLRPFVDHVVRCFGWDRIMFGSDWPVCTLSATLEQWVDAAATMFADVMEENRQQFFADNAERIYRL